METSSLLLSFKVWFVSWVCSVKQSLSAVFWIIVECQDLYILPVLHRGWKWVVLRSFALELSRRDSAEIVVKTSLSSKLSAVDFLNRGREILLLFCDQDISVIIQMSSGWITIQSQISRICPNPDNYHSTFLTQLLLIPFTFILFSFLAYCFCH